jgi:hypothetical protein
MYKYIGIRGHRGAGKNTISFLLAIAIEYYIKNHSWEGFDIEYNNTVNKLIEDESIVNNTAFDNVYLEAFSDNPKMMLSMLMGIPSEYFYDDWSKDATIVDLTDFTYKVAKDKLELYFIKEHELLYTASQLYQLSQENSISTCTHIYATLREIILYFSKFVMKSSFGSNIWVKSLIATQLEQEQFYTKDNQIIYRIFTDCKFSAEISYIYSNNGKIVKVVRNDNEKEKTLFSNELDHDNRYDFEVDLDKYDIKSNETRENIKRITLKIINND